MEEHCDAYFAWKEAGIREAWCWHVDAHLDVGRDGLDEARLQALTRGEAPLGNAYVPWGGLHCGNYLYPAIREGMVSRLTWVIPPDLPAGNLLRWAREHLNGWLDLTVQESVELRVTDGYVSGTLLGIPLQVGTADLLPRPDRPVLLDVDLDYFVTANGALWQEPGDFPESLYTTVAYSVKGGYLPTEFRRLALPWVTDTEGYAATPLDAAAALVRRHLYREALPLLALDSVEAAYLLGTCHHHLGHHEHALTDWQYLLAQGLPPDGLAYVGGLASETLCRLQRPREALDCAVKAQEHVEPDYRLMWVTAAALEQLGELRQATQMVRRGLRLAEPYVFGLQMRAVLARLYKKQGKQGLASLELAQLEKADLGGDFRPVTLLR